MANAKSRPRAAPRPATEAPLARALAALDAGNDAEAIAALVEVWRDRRSPAIAELVDLLEARQPKRAFDDVIALRADVTRKRLAAADWRDPRLSAVVLDLLEHPKFLTDAEFWDLVLDMLRESADPRLLAPFAGLRAMLHARLSPARLRDRVVRGLDDIAAKLREPREPRPDEAALETKIASRLRGARAKRDAEDAILREIYDNPMDDGPRLVYADLLAERGDPRGEFIALQFERRGKPVDSSKEARERWLLKQHMKDWLGGLAPAVSNTQSYSHTTFERGFVALADIYDSAEKQLPLTWKDPGWATVEELRGPYKHLVFEHAPLRGLRRIPEGLDVDSLATLPRIAHKLRHVEEIDLPHRDTLGDRGRELLAACDGLPSLRKLGVVFVDGFPIDDIVWLVAEAAIASRVERIDVATGVCNDMDAARASWQAVVDELGRVTGRVPVVGVVPPWRSWPRPAAVELVRSAGGTYARR